MKLTFASLITLLRIVLTPFVVVSILNFSWLQAIIFFSVAVVTDFFDGFIARKFLQESFVGKILDPVADKILLVSSMFSLLCVLVGSDKFLQMGLYFLIGKEIVLLVGALYLLLFYKTLFAPTFLSRLVSVFEMILVFVLLILQLFTVVLPWYYLYVLVVGNCIVSMILLLKYAYQVKARIA